MPLPRPRRRLRRPMAASTAAAVAAGALLLLPTAPAVAAPPEVTDGLLLAYDLSSGTGTTVTDLSGKGRDGTIVGGATYAGGSLNLDGVDDHVELPDNLMTGLSSITVSAEVLVDPTNRTNEYFIWGLGTPITNNGAWAGNGYLGVTGNAFRATISDQWWNREQNTAPGGNLERGVFKTVTYTQTGTVGTLYSDGVQVAQNTNVTIAPSAIGSGTTTRNVLGESPYLPDSTLKGKLRGFQVYDRALSADEVRSLAPDDADLVAADTAALDLGDLTAVTGNLTLPTTGSRGSTIAWASDAPGTISTTGVVNRPAAGSPAATVTLTATLTRGTASDTRTFTATVPAIANDQTRADAAAAALALVEPGDVRGNLTLPGTGAEGATVTWASSNPAVVGTDGVVTRPATGTGNSSVTMTATVTVGAATATRQIVLTVKEAPVAEPMEGYAFSYFTGNSIAGEKIYFAASRGNNALQWDELNGGQPVLTSTFGRKGLRDPFLIRSPEGDTFYLIATDLSVGGGDGFDQRNGSRYLEVWESHDLVNWSEQRHVLVSPPTAGNTWAPEAYWDEASQSYAVFWASQLYPDATRQGNSYNRMLIANTRDFRTFTEPTIWQDPGKSRIDSTVIEEDGVYHRFTKDEGGSTYNCSDIIQERSTSLTAPLVQGNTSWSVSDACIGGKAGTSAVEGPTAFKANPGDTSGSQYYLFVDEYGGRGYIPLGTDSLDPPAGGGVNGAANWKVPASYRLPASPRHGTVIPVTKTELTALRASIPTAPPVTADENGLVARYPLGTDARDASGNGYDAAVEGGGTFADGSLTLDGTDDAVKLPDNIMSGLEAITVSMDVQVAQNQSGAYFIYGLGNSQGGSGNGYLFSTGNQYRTSITSGNFSLEDTATSNRDLQRGVWKTLTYTLDEAGNATIYLDGVAVGTKTGVRAKPGEIGNGVTSFNYIGRSPYSGDARLRGKVRNFALYNRALSPAEVAGQAAPATSIASVTLASLKVPAIIDDASSTVTLPVVPGTDLTTLAPTYGLRAGSTAATSSPSYAAPVTVTVTAADGATRDWTVRAVEMRSPLLPGLNADPNIAKFGDTYYVYATSDGFPGWGGKTFYVWSSKNLVDWTRSEEPILTLDGAAGNVPWATGNAWAPTIIERAGKYYFYFSGENASDSLAKTIGVAVADSPTGPFTAQPAAMITNTESVRSGQAIDPAAFRDPETGKHYLFWGNGTPVYAELADDMVSIVPGSIKAMTGLTDYREGTFLNYREGTYHLTYAIDDTGSPNYRVGYATSDSVDGPWTYRGVILEKDASQGILGTGHSSIVQTGEDSWAIAYHRFALATFETAGGNGTNRETTIDELTFGPDGLIQKVTPTLGGIAALPVDLPVDPPVDPPVVAPPVVTPPVVVPPAPPVVTGEVKADRPRVGQRLRIVVRSSVDGPATIRIGAKRRTVQVVDGKAVVRVRLAQAGKKKLVVRTAGTKTVTQVRVRR